MCYIRRQLVSTFLTKFRIETNLELLVGLGDVERHDGRRMTCERGKKIVSLKMYSQGFTQSRAAQSIPKLPSFQPISHHDSPILRVLYLRCRR